MFITVKRHEREKQELLGISNRLTEAILKSSAHGLFMLDGKDRILLPVSHSMAGLFRRQDFANLTFEKLLAPIVTAKTLTVARNHIAALLGGSVRDPKETNPLNDLDVRLTNADGSFDSAHYGFEFEPVFVPNEARAWLIRVSDITARVQTTRELEELRSTSHTQGEILRGVLQMGGGRFGAFMQRADASMKTIATVLKKPAREEDAFRHKLDEILDEVDRVRRDAAAFKLTGLESAARVFEDALHDLRNRSALSGSDFLPLAVKLDQLYNQFALIKSLTMAGGPFRHGGSEAAPVPTTSGGTQIMEAPKFPHDASEPAAAAPHESAPAGSLESTLQALTEHVAYEEDKDVVLETSGLQMVPSRYQSAVKNVAIQLIRNAVMHGIEPPAVRKAAGKPARGTLRIEFRTRERNFELLFDDDGCGLVPEQVRATAVACGVITEDAAARMRDREAIKLIFKSRYTTIGAAGTEHGAGMSQVRHYVHEVGGKIALASLPGFETRFKITLPALPSAENPVESRPAVRMRPPADASDRTSAAALAAEDARITAEARAAGEAARIAAEARAAGEAARITAEARAAGEAARIAAEARAAEEAARIAAEARAAEEAARIAAEARAVEEARLAAEARAVAEAHAAELARAAAEAQAAAAAAQAAAEAHAAAVAQAAAHAQAAAEAHAAAVARAAALSKAAAAISGAAESELDDAKVA